MDPAHRDRIAFLRVVSGRYVKGMSARHVRLEQRRAARQANRSSWPQSARPSRTPGRATSSACSTRACSASATRWWNGRRSTSSACRASRPSTSPCVRTKDPLKRKQMEKGLEQLAEEGTIQIFQQLQMGMKDPIVGVVGAAAVRGAPVPHGARVRREHSGRQAALQPRPLGGGRRVRPATFDWEGNRQTVQDRDGLPLVLFRDDWALAHAEQKHPELKFQAHAPLLKASSVVIGPS